MIGEDTADDGEAVPIDTAHRNYDEHMEDVAQGEHYLANIKHVPACRRRSAVCSPRGAGDPGSMAACSDSRTHWPRAAFGCSRLPGMEEGEDGAHAGADHRV